MIFRGLFCTLYVGFICRVLKKAHTLFFLCKKSDPSLSEMHWEFVLLQNSQLQSITV